MSDYERGYRAGIEAAATVAEGRHEEWHELGPGCLIDDDISACTDIAAAIRALPVAEAADDEALMTGIFESLTPAQRTAALSYRGVEASGLSAPVPDDEALVDVIAKALAHLDDCGDHRYYRSEARAALAALREAGALR